MFSSYLASRQKTRPTLPKTSYRTPHRHDRLVRLHILVQLATKQSREIPEQNRNGINKTRFFSVLSKIVEWIKMLEIH